MADTGRQVHEVDREKGDHSYHDETGSNGNGLHKAISHESHLSDQERIDVFTPAEQRKIIWRIDIRLVTTLGFMYCVSLMDRTNLGIVAISGMAVGMSSTYREI